MGRFICDGRPGTLKYISERLHKVLLKVAHGIYQIVLSKKKKGTYPPIC